MSNLEEFLRELNPGQETVFDVLKEVHEDGNPVRRLSLGQRILQPEPPKEREIARAKARSHTFNDIATFGQYLKDHGTDRTLVLASVPNRAIAAVLDEADDYDREIITFEPMVHPLFAPWEALIARSPVPVLEFALFTMQHRRRLVHPNGMELAMTFSQIKSSKTITKHAGQGKKSINGVVVELEIAGERHNTAVELPDTITIEAPLMVDTPTEFIEVDLLVTEVRDQIVVYATAPDIEQRRVEAFHDLVQRLRDESGRMVGLGEIRERDWRLVEDPSRF